MDVIHEWRVDRFGKLDWQPKSGWVVNENPALSMKILSSRKLVISSSNVIMECFSLFNSALWLKCFQKGDNLLILHRVKDCSRKFRLRFHAPPGSSYQESCSSVVKVLRQYVSIVDVTNKPSSQRDTQLSQENQMAVDVSVPAQETLSGVVTQERIAQTVLGLNKMKLPAAYSACNYPTEELDTLVRLCLIDSNFPTFVSEVEKVVNNMTGKPGANKP